jgi:outer membrane lipoprotein-sorting protein
LRILASLLIVTGLCAGATSAEAGDAPAQSLDVPSLMQQMAAVKSAMARFTERHYLHVLKVPIEDSGTLAYAAPHRLQKETLLPKPERMVIDGNVLTIEHAGKTQSLKLEDNPEIGGFVEGIRATLAGDLPALERYYTVSIAGKIDDWQLLLQPRAPRMASIVASILIYGRGTQIRQINTQEGDWDRTEMTIVPEGG